MDPDYDNYGMHYDEHNDPYRDSQEEEEQTQTQSTQQASQPQVVSRDSHLWGYLIPCSPGLRQIDFWKIHPRYAIGRNPDLNQVILPGFKVSKYAVPFWSRLLLTRLFQATRTAPSPGTEERQIPASSSSICRAMAPSYVSHLASRLLLTLVPQINGEKIGRNLSRILNDGNEISFGTWAPQPSENSLEDYRALRQIVPLSACSDSSPRFHLPSCRLRKSHRGSLRSLRPWH